LPITTGKYKNLFARLRGSYTWVLTVMKKGVLSKKRTPFRIVSNTHVVYFEDLKLLRPQRR